MRIKKRRFLTAVFLAFTIVALSIPASRSFGSYLSPLNTDLTGGTGDMTNPTPGTVYAFPITLSAAGTVTQIGVNWAGSGTPNVRVALYSAGSGKPANLLTQSASTAATSATGWQDISVPSYSASAGSYWVAVQRDGYKVVWDNPSGSRSYYSKSYGAFDATWSGSSTQNNGAQWNMRVTYLTADFSISVNPPSASSQTVQQGGTAQYPLQLAGTTSSYSGSVTLSLSGTTPCPTGATCSFTQNSVSISGTTAIPVTFSVQTSTSTPATTGMQLTVSATDGSITHTQSLTLIVNAAPPIPDFTITAAPSSQSVGAGSTASSTLTLTSTGPQGDQFSGTVNLAISSGCPSPPNLCSLTPTSVALSAGGSAQVTLSVPTILTTPSQGWQVVVTGTATAGSPPPSHPATFTVTVVAPAAFQFNVKETATQIVLTLTYTSATAPPPVGTITIAGPGGNPMISESGGVVYDRTSIAVAGGTSTYSLIHRVTFTVTAPGSAQVWTAYVSLSGVSNYNLTIEVS